MADSNMNTNSDEEDDFHRDTPTLEELEKFRPNARNDMLISGWDDQDENIEVEKNPHGINLLSICWNELNINMRIIKSFC